MTRKKRQKAPIIPAIIALAICAALGISNKSDFYKLFDAISMVSTTQKEPVATDFSAAKTPSSSPAIKETFCGIVKKVYDGDTLHVLVDGEDRKVRLFGIDAPETTQEYGIDSRDYARKLVDGKSVLVRVCTIDRYQRSVAWVQTEDGKVLNEEMIKAGYAWHYVDYAKNNQNLVNLQKQAMKNKRGLWAGKNPMQPWEYRKLKRN